MDKDKSILLQKQIRDNSEDLQREFLEMQAWEEQMKRKDIEIRSMKETDKELPPIRKKKKKSSSNTEGCKEKKQTKKERIASSDYTSWDKFDVDKACEEVEENESPKKEKEKVESEIPSQEELEKRHTEASKLKDEGNALVKIQEYAKAVGKYTDAIKIFSGDAVFFANRALCQLKLDNLYSAESDCTEALRLNSKYVKAYHRRASARYELKRYKDAQKDLESILEIEPTNKEAVCLLAQVQKKIDKSAEPVIPEKVEKPSVIEKKIGEKLFAKATTSKNDSKSKEEKIAKIVEIEKVPDVENTAIKPVKTENNLVKQVIELEEDKKIKKIKPEPVEIDDGVPTWLPKLKEGIQIVETLTEAPKKSKEKLKRIPIKEISNKESIFKDVEEKFIENIETTSVKATTTSKVEAIKKTEKKKVEGDNIEIENTVTEKVKIRDNSNISQTDNIPPPPKSSVGFLLNWRKNSSPDFRHKYLKQIKPSDLPDIFKESMESNILSEILQILSTKFILNSNDVYEFLKYLAQVKRFRALLLFMSQSDKNALTKLFEYCKEQEGKSEAEVKELRSSYEM